MESIRRCLITLILAACFLSDALAQDRRLDQTTTKPEPAMPANGPPLTGKERTGRKWMDEQRIDNCNVPADKRGSKPRPDCLRSPSE